MPAGAATPERNSAVTESPNNSPCTGCEQGLGLTVKDGAVVHIANESPLAFTACTTFKLRRGGAELIAAGKCPLKQYIFTACWFCPFGHSSECHYPDNCTDAKCSHYIATLLEGEEGGRA